MKKLISLLCILAACTKPQMDDCVTSLGKTDTELRNVIAFSELYVEDRVEVILVQDSAKTGEVVLEGPRNILGQITTEVTDGKLQIRNTNTCNFVRSFNYRIKAIVYISNLETLEVESIAKVTNSDTLKLNNLNIYHNALSDINLVIDCQNEVFVQSLNSATTILRGKSRVLKGSIEEISILDARDLECEEVLIDTHTPLDCFVNGSKGLFVKIFNSGNVYYTQEPNIYKELNERRGTGNLLLLK